MKKLFSALLAAALVAASAISASAGMFVYDDSDSEYWDAALNMLDKTERAFWMEDGSAADWTISVDTNSVEIEANKLENLESGWYEVVLCDLGTNAEDFPENVAGRVAFTVRGDSTFTVKSDNAKNAGAIACLVGNNCRDEELIDEEGNVTTGAYQVSNMSVEYDTVPMGMVSSDVAVRLVSTMAGISIADAVTAVRGACDGALSLGLESKNSAWIFFGTEEEYKANTTRTDANTKTGDGVTAPVAAATTETAEATVATYPASGAEIPEGSVLINGDRIGLEMGWGENAAAGRDAAFDGDVATFFDPLAVGDGYCGIDAGEEMILTKIVIRPRNDNAARFNGATIEGANSEDFSDAVALYMSIEEAASADYIDVSDEIETADNTGYRYFRYINYTSHGDVAEVELYGYAKDGTNPTYGAEEVAVEEPVVEEPVVEEAPVEEAPVEEAPAEEAPVEEEVVVEEAVVEEAPAEEATEEEAAQTFDFGVIAAVAALISAAGYAISKKR